MPPPFPGAGAFARLRARLHLLPNWRTILARSWSMRLTIAAVALSAAEVGFAGLASDPPLPPGAFAALSAVTSGLAFWARLVAQRCLSGESKS